jgi:hypothetical protein
MLTREKKMSRFKGEALEEIRLKSERERRKCGSMP